MIPHVPRSYGVNVPVMKDCSHLVRGIATLIAAVALGITTASATLDPGAPEVALPPTPDFLLLPGVQANLAFAVQAGELVLLRSGATDNSSANWLAVISFSDVGAGLGHGVATLSIQSNWTDFALNPQLTGNVLYETETTSSSLATYSPASSPVAYLFDPPQSQPPGGSDSTVPEASTFWAGLLLLIPFGLSAFRIVRKRQAADR